MKEISLSILRRLPLLPIRDSAFQPALQWLVSYWYRNTLYNFAFLLTTFYLLYISEMFALRFLAYFKRDSSKVTLHFTSFTY